MGLCGVFERMLYSIRYELHSEFVVGKKFCTVLSPMIDLDVLCRPLLFFWRSNMRQCWTSAVHHIDVTF